MAKKKPQSSDKGDGGGGILIVAENRRARREYEILDTFEAGIVLQGSEVKSVRDGGANLADSYVRAKEAEVYLMQCHIKPYSFARNENYVPTRDRKLLLHRKEIEKLTVKLTQQGLTAIPLKMYFRNGRCKLEFAIGRGKKLYDKREDVKAREAQRSMDRVLRNR